VCGLKLAVGAERFKKMIVTPRAGVRIETSGQAQVF